MSTRMEDAVTRLLPELRHEPTDRRVRAVLGGRVVVDSTRALLVWEPRRVVPMYAVPVDEVRADLVPVSSEPAPPGLLHPGIPFSAHSTDGQALSLTAGGQSRVAAAFRPADPDLAGHVVLDFDAMDAWYEEDAPVVAHPKGPYHRVDALPSSRRVRIADGGRPIADTTRPVLVFETGLPTRYYIPRDDIVAELRPSEQRTYCPYKGEATYWSTERRPNIAWTYRNPLPEVPRIAGLVAFFDDVMEVTVDGVPRERPDTEVSRVMLEEFGVEN